MLHSSVQCERLCVCTIIINIMRGDFVPGSRGGDYLADQ